MPTKTETAFLTSLAAITGTGNFHSQGTAEFFLPEIAVKGVGELAFPLPPAQVRELVSAAEAAPYGKGMQTVRDDAVRKCWQIDASRLSLDSKPWTVFLQQIVTRVRADLGIEAKVSALPYKLLIYEKGGHFLPHRDTEKLAAMFGTLIIALPSAHEGGRLLIRHEGREVVVDFSAPERLRSFQFAALFADCEHEVEPVCSGYRCCLVYNLRLEKGDPDRLHQALDTRTKRLLPSFKALIKERPEGLSAALLEHSYTEANFSLTGLKGNDAGRAQALLSAAEELGLTAHLALLTFHQSGELVEDDSRYGRRYDDYDDDDDEGDSADGEMGEVFDESLTISHWRDSRGRELAWGEFTVQKENLLSREKLGQGAPDQKEGEGYTGNAGCTMEYWYRRAAVVWWAREEDERVRCAYDLAGACRELRLLTNRQTSDARGTAEYQRLSEAIIGSFPAALPSAYEFLRNHGNTGHGVAEKQPLPQYPFTLALDALTAARDQQGLEQLTARVPAEAFGLCGVPLWKHMLSAFGTKPFTKVIRQLTDGDSNAARSLLFQILEALPGSGSTGKRAAAGVEKDALATAGSILAALVKLPPLPVALSWQKVREPAPPGDIREACLLLLNSPLLPNAAARKQAQTFLRADASLNYIRGVLGPALLDPKVAKALRATASLIPEILDFAKDILSRETAHPPAPYPDWARPCPAPKPQAPLSPWGQDGPGQAAALKALADFMANGALQQLDIKKPQTIRSAVEDFISSHFLDLDASTIRQGTPHTLRLTKNDNSHRHALALRAQDMEMLDKLFRLGTT